MLVPGLSYPLETFVESLSSKGVSDMIKVGPWGSSRMRVEKTVGPWAVMCVSIAEASQPSHPYGR